jgi:hypothetical protein
VVNWDGVDITFEYGVPTGIGYGLAFGQVTLRSLQDKVFVPVGPNFNETDYSTRFSINFFGNLKFNPRYFVKWMSIT